MTAEKTIVIIGGGFAGTTLARDLENRLPSSHRIVLISAESYTTFNPMLAEVVGASVFPEQVVAPIRQMVKRTQFIMAKVTDVDVKQRIVHADTLAGMREIAYEHLVFAFGMRANMALVPGMEEHALPLKLVGDAMAIRNRVLQRIARIELETDSELRQRLGHFIVIGGGFSGVEVAGELADFIHSARRYYPLVHEHELRVTILQDADRLLLELPEALGLTAAQSMSKRGIAVRLKARAAKVDENGVTLASSDVIPGATVICTIGSKPTALVERLAVPTQRGRIETEPDMSVRGVPQAWAIGDCALVKNAANDQFSPPTAQFAVAQAQQLAMNIAQQIMAQPTHQFSYESKGMMATIGHMNGVAQVYGIRLSGIPAWLLWRAFYLARMPTWGRKIRIWVEWTWSMFFKADITHLRFTRTNEVEEKTAQEPVRQVAHR